MAEHREHADADRGAARTRLQDALRHLEGREVEARKLADLEVRERELDHVRTLKGDVEKRLGIVPKKGA